MLVTAVRHAESLGNAGMLTEPDPDPLLSPVGVGQARAAAARLAREGATHIWSSPFRRTIQTASFLADAAGLEVLLVPEMVEHYLWEDLDGYVGRTGEELRTEFPCVRVPGTLVDGAWAPEFPESWAQLLMRTHRVAERALELPSRDNAHLVVFGHGASAKGLAYALLGEEVAADVGFVNTGMTRVRLDGALPGEAVFINDDSHLSECEETP